MANVESPFNPEYERKHEETYDFRGADAPNAQRGFTPYENSNDIANAVNIFNAGVTGRDELTKKRIYDEAVEQVDAVRDPWTGQDASPEGIRSGSTPTDLRRQFERMKGMDAAYKAGRSSDRHYWAQMENIARSVRARYPGYREHIDNVISDITGGTPANVLQRSIQEEVDGDTNKFGVGGSATRQLQKDFFTGENALEAPDDYESWDFDTLMKWGNNKQAVRANSKRQIEDLERRVQAGTATGSLANQTLNSQFLTRYATENEKQIKGLTTAVDQALATNKPLSPEMVQEIQRQSAVIKQNALNLYDQMRRERPDLYGMISPTDVDNQRKSIIAMIDGISETVGGPLNLAKANLEKFNMMTEQRTVQLAQGMPTFLDGAAWSKGLGQNGANIYFSSPNVTASGEVKGTMLDQLGQENLNRRKQEMFDMSKPSNSSPVVSGVDKIANASEEVMTAPEKSAAIKNFVESNVTALTNPETSIEYKERAAENWFGEGNADFLSAFNSKDSNNPLKNTGMTKVSLYQMLNSPAVAKSMAELRTSSPKGEELYQNYQEWRSYNFYALMKSEIDTMKSIPVTDQTMNIQFDTKTGKMITQERLSGGEGTAAGWARKNVMSWINGSQSAVRRYNGMIDALTPTWKLEGKDPGVEAAELLKNVEIPYGAEKETSFADKFATAISEFVFGNEESDAASAKNYEEFQKAATSDRNREGSAKFAQPMRLGGPKEGETPKKMKTYKFDTGDIAVEDTGYEFEDSVFQFFQDTPMVDRKIVDRDKFDTMSDEDLATRGVKRTRPLDDKFTPPMKLGGPTQGRNNPDTVIGRYMDLDEDTRAKVDAKFPKIKETASANKAARSRRNEESFEDWKKRGGLEKLLRLPGNQDYGGDDFDTWASKPAFTEETFYIDNGRELNWGKKSDYEQAVNDLIGNPVGASKEQQSQDRKALEWNYDGKSAQGLPYNELVEVLMLKLYHSHPTEKNAQRLFDYMTRPSPPEQEMN